MLKITVPSPSLICFYDFKKYLTPFHFIDYEFNSRTKTDVLR